MWLLAFSLSVPEESGVRRTLVTHDSMELTAHPFPAPRSFLLEAEQLLRDRFLFWLRHFRFQCRIIKPLLFGNAKFS